LIETDFIHASLLKRDQGVIRLGRSSPIIHDRRRVSVG
jgi:hypothetical protein